jgi:antitoxin HicB
MRQPLSFYLQQKYPYTVTPDPDGGFFIAFPDLPGSMTQVEDTLEIVEAAEEVRTLWLETAYAHEMDIPLPRANADYSGKFVLRVPRSLHRRLAESAEQEGVSLNHYVVSLLAMNDADRRVERRLDLLAHEQVSAPHDEDVVPRRLVGD